MNQGRHTLIFKIFADFFDSDFDYEDSDEERRKYVRI